MSVKKIFWFIITAFFVLCLALAFLRGLLLEDSSWGLFAVVSIPFGVISWCLIEYWDLED